MHFYSLKIHMKCMPTVDDLFVHLQSDQMSRLESIESRQFKSNNHLSYPTYTNTHLIHQSIQLIQYSHPKRLSVQSAPSQRRRSRTVLFPSGSVFALTILSSITQRDVIGVVPSLVFKLVLSMIRKMGQIGVLVIDGHCWKQ